MKTTITEAGKKLLLGGLTGEKITFTRAEFGNGKLEELEGAAHVGNPQVSSLFASDELISIEGYITLRTSFTNNDIETAFKITEIGYFARQGDGEDVLYCYVTYDASEADRVPAGAERYLTIGHEQQLYIGDVSDITAVFVEQGNYVSKAAFEKHLSDTNPHGLTKIDIGLGSVPNQRAEDQTITFVEMSAPNPLKSGETLCNFMSKLGAAVKSLIAHLAARSNPHGVTAAQVGAAEAEHTHAASDINSGVLPASRGGTGVSSLKELGERIGETGALPTIKIGDIVLENTATSGGGTQITKTVEIEGSPRIIFVCHGPLGSGRLIRGHIEKSYLAYDGSTGEGTITAEWGDDSTSLTVKSGFPIYPGESETMTYIAIY